MQFTIQELIENSPDKDASMLYLTKWYAAKCGIPITHIKMLIVDQNKVFPILHNDPIQDIVQRFIEIYPEETNDIIKYVSENLSDNPDGSSGLNHLRSVLTLPVMLRAAIVASFGEKYLTEKKNVVSIAKMFPKLSQTNTNKL